MKTILCPMEGEHSYDVETQVEMKDLFLYYRSTGCTDFALLDALSLVYSGNIVLH